MDFFKQIEEIECIEDRNVTNIPSVSIEEAKSNSASSSIISQCSKISNIQQTLKNEIKKQFFINDVGHFKYLRNNTIVINFVDKVKLCVNEESIGMFLKDNLKKCFFLIYLPDNSQHEICMAEKSSINTIFLKYFNFLEQWLQWLLDTQTIKKINQQNSNVSHTDSHVNQDDEVFDYRSLQIHLSQLKLFNYKLNQENESLASNTNNIGLNNEIGLSENQSIYSVHNLLKENSKFLKDLSN